jgi:hypothetical protein
MERLRIGAEPDEGRPQRARRIDRGAGDVDAEQVKRDEREPDGEASEPDRRTCPFRKSYPDVLMVQSSQDRNGDNGARSLDCSM